MAVAREPGTVNGLPTAETLAESVHLVLQNGGSEVLIGT